MFCLFVTGCGQQSRNVAPEIVPFVNLFEREMDTQVITTIVFGEMVKKTSIAECYVGANYIVVDKKQWDKESIGKRINTIFHELGHCHLKLDHENNKIPFNHKWIPISIMNEYQFDLLEIPCLYKDYIRQLKDGTSIRPELCEVRELDHGRYYY